MTGSRLDVLTLSSIKVSNSFCVDACSIIVSGVESTIFSAVERDEDASDDLANEDTLAIDAAVAIRDTGDVAVVKVNFFFVLVGLYCYLCCC
mmetsp:Transcript_702/g.1440  ORF Transcript_702/g.1440 Transcript_702/m.1440 type:complete len:92 (-) Transcript_702:416-691(-)